jgi:hypothetical protein
MDLPYCKICGERHQLGHCPEWDMPPEKPHAKPVARKDQAPAQGVAEESPTVVAEDPWHQEWREARQLSPEDMKQETMPDITPRFDRNAYQRDLMRKRRWKAVDADTA